MNILKLCILYVLNLLKNLYEKLHIINALNIIINNFFSFKQYSLNDSDKIFHSKHKFKRNILFFLVFII